MARVDEGESVNEVPRPPSYLALSSSVTNITQPWRQVNGDSGDLQAQYYAIFHTRVKFITIFFMPKALKNQRSIQINGAVFKPG